MSPEMINKNVFSIKSDIWSLGMTLYLCIIKNYDSNNLLIDENMLSLYSKKIKDDYGRLFYDIIKIMLVRDEKERLSTQEICNIIKKSRYYLDNDIKLC